MVTEKVGFWHEPVFILSVVATLAFGSLSPNASQWAFKQDSYPCKDKLCEPQRYDDFMVQVFAKYIGMFLLSVTVYSIDRLRHTRNKKPFISKSEDIEANRLFQRRRHVICLISAIFEVGYTSTARLGTYYTKSSTHLLMGNMSVVVSALSKVILNKESIMVCEYLGMVLLLGGCVTFSWLDSISDQSINPINVKLGLWLCAISAVCQGLTSSVQQKVFSKRHYPATKYVAIESAFSFMLTLILSFGMWCFGSFNYKEAYWSTFNNPKVLSATFCFGGFSAGYNVSQTVSGKFVCGLYRILLVRVSGIFVWIWELLLGFGQFTYYSLIANIFVIIGSLVFGGLFLKKERCPWFFYAPVCGSLKAGPRATNYDEFCSTRVPSSISNYSDSFEPGQDNALEDNSHIRF